MKISIVNLEVKCGNAFKKGMMESQLIKLKAFSVVMQLAEKTANTKISQILI